MGAQLFISLPIPSAIFLGPFRFPLFFNQLCGWTPWPSLTKKGSVIIGGPVQECEDFLDFRLQRATRTPSMDLSRTVIFRQLFSADLTAHDPDPVTQSEPGLPDISLIPEE